MISSFYILIQYDSTQFKINTYDQSKFKKISIQSNDVQLNDTLVSNKYNTDRDYFWNTVIPQIELELGIPTENIPYVKNSILTRPNY
jgi:hypothetical protein